MPFQYPPHNLTQPSASFHPLTNRKHHCRLCGQIICSLPVKRPQRPETCSLLFVVDPKTRRIEEVGEGVDYGVRKRRSLPPPVPGKGKEKATEEPLQEDEKFLKGVRICRQCRHVLLWVFVSFMPRSCLTSSCLVYRQQQYHQEVAHVPTFVKLYEVILYLPFVAILSHHFSRPSSVSRKRSKTLCPNFKNSY